jgi:acyl-CoA synthetase (AMP-forming)/AMP-acid ligase II
MQLILLTIVAVIAAGLVYKNLRLMRYVMQYLRMQWALRLFLFRQHTVADEFAARVKASPHAPAIIFEGRTYTYLSLDRLSNRVAEWALTRAGLRPREVVALQMENSVDFVVTWLGLAKIGVTVALINTSLRNHALSHSLRCSEARLIIVGAECLEAFEPVRNELAPHVHVWISYENIVASPPSADNLSLALSQIPDEQPRDFRAVRKAAKMNSTDLLFLIFTSGTVS